MTQNLETEMLSLSENSLTSYLTESLSSATSDPPSIITLS